MKITIEIPDNTILATISLATQDREHPSNVRLGMSNIATKDLKDGNTVDLRPKDNTSEDAK